MKPSLTLSLVVVASLHVPGQDFVLEGDGIPSHGLEERHEGSTED